MPPASARAMTLNRELDVWAGHINGEQQEKKAEKPPPPRKVEQGHQTDTTHSQTILR